MSTYFALGNQIIHDSDEVGVRRFFRSVRTRDIDFIAREVKKKTVSKPSRLGRHYGRGVGYGVYVWSYPITLIDGPLPVIDLAWLVGFYKAGERGATIGGDIGAQLNLP